MIDLTKVGGIGEFETEEFREGEKGTEKLCKVWNEDGESLKNARGDKTVNEEKRVGKLFKAKDGKVFLVDRERTIEVRTDQKLAKFLAEKYESVMESRYFGKGGIEIVMSGQLSEDELGDLVRLSYNMSLKNV